MSTVIESSFIKYCSNDTVVLFGGGDRKPISEFVSVLMELSNYQRKTQTYSRTKTDNQYIRLEDSVQQTITGWLKYVNSFGETYDETQDPEANTYLTISEVDAKSSSKMDSITLDNLVNTIYDSTINGSKTFTNNVNATGSVKTDKEETSVLLAGGGDMLLSSFEGIEDLTQSAFSGNYNAGTFNTDYLVQHDVAVATYIPFPKTFVLPVLNATTKLDLSSQLERSSFLALSGSDPKLTMHGDRVTSTVSYETTGLFLNRYLFKSYPEEARPKAGDEVITLVGTEPTNKNKIFCYINQNGPFIITHSLRESFFVAVISYAEQLLGLPLYLNGTYNNGPRRNASIKT
ncbi:MAG: hypothetical protein EZS28_015371 [Streblomastix strix]|uniref:Uncharacterized protein n=1 Tax=Streblomastix strix TaxID=222440 RepID=A0A5J4W362_9EUKA|nr:MAG: hypothetical protein EZS28_015371 [Streblomastix strix]